MAEEKLEPKSSAPGKSASILANDTAPKKAAAPKTMGGGAEKSAASAAPKPEHAQHAAHAGKAKHKHTHIEHHENGTHTTRHTPADGGPDVSYASQDLDGVHDGLEHHVGEPNGEEAQAQPDPNAGAQPDAAAGGAAPQAGAQPQPGAGATPQAV
jgi:hypothetical protein